MSSKLSSKISKTLERGGENLIRVLITLTVLASVLFLFHFNLLERFEYVTYDYRMLLRGQRAADPRIVVIEISDDSVAKIGR